MLDTLHDTEARLDGALQLQENSDAKLLEMKQTHDNMFKDKDDIYIQYQETQQKLYETEESLNQAHDENMNMDVSLKEVQFTCQQLTEEKRKLQVKLKL